MKRLNIVVPYRDREEHLQAFVPHLRAYFARDKADCQIPYRVIVVEQDKGGAFNRGALKNVGFLLGLPDSDYTCFHDVDYLPIWADYSYVDVPTPLVWHGAHTRPISPDQSNQLVVHELEGFFGGAVLVPNSSFENVDGYSNEYWGWGYEDEDLKRRFRTAGISVGRRKGTYSALDHENEGFSSEGLPSKTNLDNKKKMLEKWTQSRRAKDGLSTLKFEILDRREMPDGVPEREASWEIVTVRFLDRR
jgi:hypothetical protein